MEFDTPSDLQTVDVGKGCKYIGQLNKKNEKEGFGIMKYNDGAIYIGNWKSNK